MLMIMDNECSYVLMVDLNGFMKIVSIKNTSRFVVCDLEYPKNLNNLHNAYPLAPERRMAFRLL